MAVTRASISLPARLARWALLVIGTAIIVSYTYEAQGPFGLWTVMRASSTFSLLAVTVVMVCSYVAVFYYWKGRAGFNANSFWWMLYTRLTAVVMFVGSFILFAVMLQLSP